MLKIPKIIHQIWSDKYRSLPVELSVLSNTWREKHSDWEYICWNEEMMDVFVKNEYPDYYNIYRSLPFDMQRWDSVRFLILYKIGGVHIDFDYECLENIAPILSDHSCCIALEPQTHCIAYGVKHFLNSAFLASTPSHSFLDAVISKIFSVETLSFNTQNKARCIMYTTGPLMLSNLYENLSNIDQDDIYLLPAKYITPFDAIQIKQVRAGIVNQELENCLKDAYAVHYFTNLWVDL